MQTFQVYITHFSEALSHSQHYTGSGVKAVTRVNTHRKNRSNLKFLQAAHQNGITLHLSYVKDCPAGDGRQVERKVKNRHANHYCPICNEVRLSDGTRCVYIHDHADALTKRQVKRQAISHTKSMLPHIYAQGSNHADYTSLRVVSAEVVRDRWVVDVIYNVEDGCDGVRHYYPVAQ
jgi:hypothetical protein